MPRCIGAGRPRTQMQIYLSIYLSTYLSTTLRLFFCFISPPLFSTSRNTKINHFMYTSISYDALNLLCLLPMVWGHYPEAILCVLFLFFFPERCLNSVLNVGPGHPILRAILSDEHDWRRQTGDEKRAELWFRSGQQSLLLHMGSGTKYTHCSTFRHV